MKKLGIYLLLCVFGLWVSPGVMAAYCAGFVAPSHAHEHSEGAAGGEAHSQEAPEDADACCLQFFVGGTDAVTPTLPSSLARPAMSGKAVALAGLPTPFLPALLHNARSFSALFKASTEGLQRPLYALFSTYLI